MRVLVLSDYYLPGYRAGGPLRTLANMVEQFGDEVTFRVITRDRDFGAGEPFADVTPGVWQSIGKAEVLYLPPGALSLQALREVLRGLDYDVLYLNSFFSPDFTLKPLLLRHLGRIPRCPVVLAPRGEFSPGAVRLKGARKRAFIAAARAVSLYRDVVWQASSEYERDDVRRWFGPEVPILIAPDVPSAPAASGALPQSLPKQEGRCDVVFLSRISRKKNLDGALRMLAGLRGEVRFDIYGPLEDHGYWRDCQRLIAALPANVRAEYRGTVPHEDVTAVMSRHHLFLLPTLGENFGHVILEALVGGCPVLISDQTPWRGLAAEGAGWELPLSDPEAFRTVLQRCIDMSAEEHASLSARAARYGLFCSRDEEVLRQNRELFRRACASVSGVVPASATGLIGPELDVASVHTSTRR